ncbi:NAD(P)H-dependent flavin oxidoreductase [Naumannella cuiyingiana]|uniref:Propionate 3-nitronate monooxygenase n=1 Tax=Naumannella cuiyingiana TaxID=1347891 RepID=A0A7Z0D6W3_9ACTN|nr:nitronate monooxygenase [Naumannella cuiyingiana]NYI69987.1 nitronate monooxygenase [Naumannella cuiyingiana]
MSVTALTDLPIAVAPMAGPGTPALAAAVSEAGGLGNLPAGYAPASSLAADIAAVRELTERPFGVNVFCPQPMDEAGQGEAVARFRDRLRSRAEGAGVALPEVNWADTFDHAAKIELLVAVGPAVVSFTFGCPTAEVVQRLQRAGSAVVVTVTGAEEAAAAAEVGADGICVQGAEAGGHRGTFDGAAEPNTASTTQLLAACRPVGLPMIAAGGLMTAAEVAQARAAGASMAQCGTAYLLADEAGTSAPYRRALAEPGRQSRLIRSFSGRVARGLGNAWTEEFEPYAPAAFPAIDQLTKPLRAAATKADDAESINLWAGTGWGFARAEPAAVITRRLAG